MEDAKVLNPKHRAAGFYGLLALSALVGHRLILAVSRAAHPQKRSHRTGDCRVACSRRILQEEPRRLPGQKRSHCF